MSRPAADLALEAATCIEVNGLRGEALLAYLTAWAGEVQKDPPGVVTVPQMRAALREYPDAAFTSHLVRAEEVLKALDEERSNGNMLLRVINHIGKEIGEHPEALWKDPSVVALALRDVAVAVHAATIEAVGLCHDLDVGGRPDIEALDLPALVAQVVAERAARS